MTAFRGPTSLADIRAANRRAKKTSTPSGTDAIQEYEKRVAQTSMPTSQSGQAAAGSPNDISAYAPPRALPTNEYDFSSGLAGVAPPPAAAVAGGSGYGNDFTGGKGFAAGSWQTSLSPAELELFKRESSLNPLADNPTSTAFGIWQGLQSTRDAYGRKVGVNPNTTNPWEQLLMARAYIKDRYGSAENAWRFWQANRWY